ncbi:hypothetical protein U8P73_31115 (plasmid) [Rhizobium beringeri]|uniref:hypothetical protein n=1 Tax=Rhizobium beringeri TaxID=3019934 RepID=UPI002DDC9B73|nr:hypothetical protein [Rhizobium beringeri]WSG92826.1 hypothetical protein U8P73_31115 [Rhizobium beringeri]
MSASNFSGSSSPLCLVPVKNGQPTKDDIYQSFRLTSKVVAVTGLNRPIIFPSNRGGVWTIDGSGAYVPFGGDFPNHYLDEYASDASGDVIGVSWKLGVFRLRAGSKEFERLYAADGKPFIHPFSTAYVERLGGTVISDNSGLYLLRPSGAVERLRWDESVGGKSPGRVFDLPELRLLLFTAEGYVYAGDDEGNLSIFDKGFDGVEAARVTDDGNIFLKRGQAEGEVVPWPPKDLTILPAKQGAHTYENFEGIETYVGTLVKVHGKRISVHLPWRVNTPPMEFPGGTIVANAGPDGLYTLDSEKTWEPVDHSREIAGNIIHLFQLPAENEALLVNGREGLFLLVKKSDPRAVSCLR